MGGGRSAPDNSAQIKAAQEQTRLAREQEERAKQQALEAAEREKMAKDRQKLSQEKIVEDNKTRRRHAFQRFSLLLVGDNNDEIGAGVPTDTTVG